MSKKGVAPYIVEARKAGKSDQQIRSELIQAGWQIDIIDKALNKQPSTYSANHSLASHFTKYSDWYTKKPVIYGCVVIVTLLFYLQHLSKIVR